jgi:phenylpropionate dioxygenase-like ring-hydroxylating dioxygenase large terminal subunit
MGMLDHWQPAVPSRSLTDKPVGLRIADRQVCVFRPQSGGVAAVDDVCPHRRLKLSYGKVVGDRIRCEYHGWTFDACGNGESPGTPKLTTCTEAFDATEANGYVWVKARGKAALFPKIESRGWFHLGDFEYVIPTPLELAVDNFNEIEHSGTVHSTFGYELDTMNEVKVGFDWTDTSVTVTNVGPTKRLFRPFAWLLGIRPGDLFHDEWTTRFSPVYSVFDHWWTSPDGSREGMVRWRLYEFFTPIDADNTRLTAFVYAKSRYPGPAGGLRLAKPIFRRELAREIGRDVDMLKNLADRKVAIDGMKLSRFDKVLGLTRERINTVYRGEPAGRLKLA